MRLKLFFLTLLVSLTLVSYAAALDVCCEKLAGSEEYCVYTDSEQCDGNFKQAAVGCEQTSFCKIGCCYSSDEGQCFKNAPRAECAANKGTWAEDKSCSITQCKKGCCLLGPEGFFVTEVKCKLETSKYEGVQMTFKPEVATELECTAMAKSQDLGCCVSGNECKFTTRDNCATASLEPTASNETKDGFYKDMLCSNDKLSCGCAKQAKTGCLPDGDEVYWLDSCGNRENIYSANKDASYNNGYLSKTPSCTLSGAYDKDCGACDYAAGTICGKAAATQPTHGEYICKSTSCSETYADGISPNAGTPKKNGESWCIYDSKVGHAEDPVGSRHYRHICINGEEMVESCMDFREEICIQGVMEAKPTGTYEAFKATGEYVEAACRDNRWESCFDCNADAKPKECCTKLEARDCYWIPAQTVGLVAVPPGEGACASEVPPGLKFWSEDRVEALPSTTRSTGAAITDITGAAITTGTGKTPTSNAESVCSRVNQECTVKWHRSGWSRIFDKKDWECTQNCYCMDKAWVIGGNNLCKAMGDCGAYYNILGKSTMDGYTNTASGERKFFTGYTLTEKDLDDWSVIVSPGGALDDDTEDGGFYGASWGTWFKKAGIPLALIAIQGLVGQYGFGAKDWTTGMTAGIGGTLSTVFSLGKEKNTWSAYGTTTKYEPITTINKGTILSEDSYNNIKGKFDEKQFEKVEGGYKYTGDKEFPVDKLDLEEGTKIEGVAGEKTSGTGKLMGAANTALWLYTIYQIIDVIAAEDKDRTYTMTCGAWVAPAGGEDCEECNKDAKNKPCSLYKCKSLGQLCSLINEGTAEEKCINIHPNDVNTPIITPWKEVIPEKYTITETTFEGNKGFKVNEKIGAFETVALGIKTDEPAQCKFTKDIGKDFDEMTSFFGDQLYVYDHQIEFKMPEEFTAEQAIKLTNGGKYTLYLRCKDTSGNKNERDYFIQFEVKPSPDMTAPVIERTSIENGAYIPHGVDETQFSIYINEQANCKWDKTDLDYEAMQNSFECKTSPEVLGSVYFNLYECKANLENLYGEKIQDYVYYIRCQDTENNKNAESFTFTLRGTEELIMQSLGPRGITFYEPDVTLKAVTSGGAENGKATCAFSTEDESFSNMVIFATTDTSLHEQPLTFTELGTYTYYVKCMDVAGNEAADETTFTVDIDMVAPEIIYLYVAGSTLHLEMSEPSICEYSNSTFYYGTGKQMTGMNTVVHEVQITQDVYYISCVDEYLNEASFIVYP